MSDGVPAPAGDPRVARSRAAVLAATVDLLGEVGHRGTTIEAVAERSGVAKTTVYRHWPTRAALLVDAFASLVEGHEPPDTGDLRADLTAVGSGLAAKLADPGWSRVMATLLDAAESDPELAELSAALTDQRRRAARTVLERAQADGTARDDLDADLAVQLLAGTLFYRRFLLRDPADDTTVEAIVDILLTGLAPA